MNITIVGSNSFVAKNFYSSIAKEKKIKKIFLIKKNTSKIKIRQFIQLSQKIFIFAGINRDENDLNFKKNLLILKKIISYVDRKKKIFFMSSTQINNNSAYGKSKKECENYLMKLYKKKTIDLKIYRLPNLFGKWSRPNHNSVVATFCFNVIRNKPLKILKNINFKLLYIDDFIKLLIKDLKKEKDSIIISKKFSNSNTITAKDLKFNIIKIHKNYKSKNIINFSNKLLKNLYSTYLTFLRTGDYKYQVNNIKKDNKGFFLELFKSKYFGQISLIKIKTKNIRGNHFHHTKFEKFLLINGKVRYVTKDIFKKKEKSFVLKDGKFEIVNTIPGHLHYIENMSEKPSTLLIWSNEVFDIKNPDTLKI